MWRSILVSMFVMSACHSMVDDSGAMRGFISEAKDEAQQHLTFARAATSVQDLRVDADRYRDAMMPMMADMDTMMEGMGSHCDGMSEMRDMHAGLGVEMSQHVAT